MALLAPGMVLMPNCATPLRAEMKRVRRKIVFRRSSSEASVANGTRHGRHAGRTQWPDPAKPPGALFYAVVAGLIVWLLVDMLSHLHVSIGWH